MSKFCVRVEEKSTLHLDIEANSAKEARDKVEQMIAIGEILFDESKDVEYDIDVSAPSEYDNSI